MTVTPPPTEEERLALAVLGGDLVAAGALADWVIERGVNPKVRWTPAYTEKCEEVLGRVKKEFLYRKGQREAGELMPVSSYEANDILNQIHKLERWARSDLGRNGPE